MLAETTINYPYANLGDTPQAFTAIYQENCNIAIWRQSVPPALVDSLSRAVVDYAFPSLATIVEPEQAKDLILERYSDMTGVEAFADHVALVIDMYCCLFDLNAAGLRLKKLTGAMCPKFHVDHVPCRLVVTYCGVATQWLIEDNIDRTKLGIASAGLTDEQSGICLDHTMIEQMQAGDVALLKGEKWLNNEGRGLVHRSPSAALDSPRIVMTLDFAR